jgi:hypothetical protein
VFEEPEVSAQNDSLNDDPEVSAQNDSLNDDPEVSAQNDSLNDASFDDDDNDVDSLDLSNIGGVVFGTSPASL